MVSLVLGQEQNGELGYQGHVTLGVTMDKVSRYPTGGTCPFALIPLGSERAVWFQPPLPRCTVTYMERTSAGGIRQPRLKAIEPL